MSDVLSESGVRSKGWLTVILLVNTKALMKFSSSLSS